MLLKPLPFVAACYQFGSTVRGQAGPLSDLDLALLLKAGAPTGIALLKLELLLAYEIQKQLGVREVDLITLNHQRLSLQHTILKTGHLLYEADPLARIQFMYRVIRAYLDFQPTLRFIAKFHTQGRLRRCGLR